MYCIAVRINADEMFPSVHSVYITIFTLFYVSSLMLHFNAVGSANQTYKVYSELLNATQANNSCLSSGGFLLDWYSLNETEKQAVINQSDATTVWISGLISFSEFVSWEGCFRISKYVEKTPIEGNNIYLCDKFCSNQSWTYIGLSGQYCYCFTRINGFPVKDEQCFTKCKSGTMNPEICGGSETVAVYRHSEVDINPEIGDQLASNQCVFYTENDTVAGEAEYGVDACNKRDGVTNSLNGFLCEDQLQRIMNEFSATRCTEENIHACVFNTQTNWDTARSICTFVGGRLVRKPETTFPESQNFFQLGRTYWTGIFRTFVIAKNGLSKMKSCLIVNMLTEEVTVKRCSDLFNYICMYRNSSIDKHRENEKNSGDTPQSVLAVLGVFICFFLALNFVLCFYYKKKVKRIKKKTHKESRTLIV